MESNAPQDQVPAFPDTAGRASGVPWSFLAAAGGSLGILLLLARFAIDLLAPLCLLVLVAHSVRDTFLDWLSGESYVDEPDPVWAVCAVVASLAGTVVGVLWLFSTSPWARTLAVHDWLPPGMIQVARAAEDHGWGRRVMLPGGPVAQPRAARNPAPLPAQGEPVRQPDARQGGAAVATTGASASVERPASTVGGTPPRASPAAGAGPRAPAPTFTTLSSSATVLRVGSRVEISARVTAAAGSPSGTVVFRNGPTPIGSAILDERGVGTLIIENLPAGSHAITAEFRASPAFLGSRSRARVLVVNP
jgi:hypothetical protein